MTAIERVWELESQYKAFVKRISLLEVDDQTIRLIFCFIDGTNLRVAEQWKDGSLQRYSFYWLTTDNNLIMGWDNAPHHITIETFPHHKHIKNQKNLEPSSETCLEDVMAYIRGEMNK